MPIDIVKSILNEPQENFFANLNLVSSGENNVLLMPDEAEIQINPVGGEHKIAHFVK